MYRHRYPSPAQSATSLSELDEDDANKSTFFQPADSLVLTPAQWSSKLRMISSNRALVSDSTMSNLPPELLIHIFRHLHSPRDLYNCLLVSKTWCECSVELLWHKPSFSSLLSLIKVMRVLGRPNQTFTYARFIRRLNFLFVGADLKDSLLSRLAQCDRLERLTLVNCAHITDDALTSVLPCCPNLVAIDLTGVVDTTDRAVVGLALAAKRLQGINLGGCKKVTDKGILALALNCPLLRRVKLSGVEFVTDGPISALAKQCPLLLEIDLNHCKRITDASVRDIWIHSTHMREMRLSYCEELTDAAFPSPVKPEADAPAPLVGPKSFVSSHTQLGSSPLVLSHPFDQLRMLDLTGCSFITDDAIEGIIYYSPKIRNLVLAKCGRLTDRTVESICLLGKHLHYLHLGHAVLITDCSVRFLARFCTRLRYVDFANCTLLTDMAAFELASLPKLRRIGLTRVSNLTDEAVYSLANREATLERIHLSYCDQITTRAIRFLLQKLHKLTHLTLTGIPAFLDPKLQKFCRSPPPEFNTTQRAAFCVYSGKGVLELRAYLTEIYRKDMIAADDSTEYDDEDGYTEEAVEMDVETWNDVDDDEDFSQIDNVSSASFLLQAVDPPAATNGSMVQNASDTGEQGPSSLPAASRATSGRPASPNHTPGPSDATRTPSHRTSHGIGFGHQPIVERSASPTHSEVPSNRSTGTTHSNVAGFFRTYQEIATSSARSNRALTPDLNFAEIGHGRGADHRITNGSNGTAVPSSLVVDQGGYPPSSNLASQDVNPSRSYENTTSSRPMTWPHIQREVPSSLPTNSPTQEQDTSGDSIRDGSDRKERGRSLKRSLRNVAEHLGSSLFRHQSVSNGGVNGEGSGSHVNGHPS